MRTANKKIVSLALAVVLLIAASPVFAVEASGPARKDAEDSFGLFQTERILPDLSNLEAPPPSPARSGTGRSLELVPRDAEIIEPLRNASSGMTRGSASQDNPSMVSGGQYLAKLVSYTGNGIHGFTVAYAPFSGTPLLPIVTQGMSAVNPRDALNADANLANDINSAVSAMESNDYSAIGDVSWVPTWNARQVKVILTQLNTDPYSGILLGYFDPNDFPGGTSQNSDYYLYIDVSDFAGFGFDRYKNNRSQFIGTILREYAHLVNFSAGYAANGGMANAQMQTWLDEAIATAYAYNYTNIFEQPYLDGFLKQNFASGVGYVPDNDQWQGTNANYGAAALMMLDLTQYENPLVSEPMRRIIHYDRTNNTYANSLNAVANAYGAANFNDFFTQFNLDVAVDNDPDDHAAALADLGSNFYGLDAIDYIWRQRYDSGSYAGVTSLSPNTAVEVSAEFGDRTYYSHIYLADTVGSDCSQVKIEVPNDPQTRYFVIVPYGLTDVDTDTEWQDCAKQAAPLTVGTNRVIVGSNNQFAVLAVQYSAPMGSGKTLNFSRISSAKDITSFRLNGVEGAISGNNITVVLATGTDVTNAIPTIAHTGVSIAPVSGAAQDLTSPVTYTVTAQDGSTKTYTVTVELVEGPYVDESAITLNAGETKAIYVSLGQSGNMAGSAAISSSNASIASASPTNLEASGNVVITGERAGNAVISVLFSGGDLASPTDIPVTVHVTAPIAHAVTVQSNGNGTACANKTTAAQGETVTLTATPASGYVFSRWEVVSGGITLLGNSFVMPDNDITVKAHFRYNGGGGSDSGDSSPTPTVTPPPAAQPDWPTIGSVSGKVAGTTAQRTFTISDSLVKAALEKAQTEAKAKNRTAYGVGVRIALDAPTTAKLTLTLERAALSRLVSENAKRFEITGIPVGVTLDAQALAELQRQSDGDVTIAIKSVTVKGVRNAYDITLSAVNDGKTVKITGLGTGSAILAIPCVPGKSESAGFLYAVHLDGEGKVNRIANSTYDAASGSVLLRTNHFSVYGVGYTAPSVKFTDTKKHWAAESIDYVVGRGLFSGTSEVSFFPDAAIARSDFITALGRMANVDTKAYTKTNFIDVAADKLYAPYVDWAYTEGIVQDSGGGKFQPDRMITHEEIAVILQNYAKATGYKLPITYTAVTYADAEPNGNAYKTAVMAMQQAGIMMDQQTGRLNPAANTTRAEASAMLHRYIRLIIDPVPAQDWALNDSGQ